jgi:chromosome segregation ATPase
MIFNKQKRYFQSKYDGVKKMTWDLEFKRFKTKEIREDIRAEYDGLKSKLSILDEQIKSEKDKPTMKKGERARLKDKKTIFERDIKRYEDQMAGLDMEIQGSKATEELPDGYQGINQQLDALRELEGMVKDYIKKL